MSCNNCDKKNEGQGGIAYYRWKHANVAMMGCDTHLREIFDALSKTQKDYIPKAEVLEVVKKLQINSIPNPFTNTTHGYAYIDGFMDALSDLKQKLGLG